MSAPLPDWAHEEQLRCADCGAHLGMSSGGWIDDDGCVDGADGHEHVPGAAS